MEPFLAFEHVQLAMPRGQEAAARTFYVGILGMTELPKPAELATRGGCWFASGRVHVHLGVEEDFRPARKAHPGLLCNDYGALLSALRSAGIDIREDSAIPGVERSHIDDPFGNRIELIACTR